MKYYLGIDPGTSGAYVVLDKESNVIAEARGSESCLDRAEMLKDLTSMSFDKISYCLIEQVSAMPGQGVSSTFKFGQSFGEAIGIVESLGIRYELIRPAKWQHQMECRTKGDKNVSKRKAQNLFPQHKVIHANADALLIAELARRIAIHRGL